MYAIMRTDICISSAGETDEDEHTEKEEMPHEIN